MDATSTNLHNKVQVTTIEETESKEKDLDKNPLQGLISSAYHSQIASSTSLDNQDSLHIQNYGSLCQLTTTVNTIYVHMAPIQKPYESSEIYHQCSYNKKITTALTSHDEKATDVISVNANNGRLLSIMRAAESNSMQVDEIKKVKKMFCIHLGIILVCIILVAIYFTIMIYVT